MNRVPVMQSQQLESMHELLNALNDAKWSLLKNGMLSVDFIEQTMVFYDTMIDRQISLIREFLIMRPQTNQTLANCRMLGSCNGRKGFEAETAARWESDGTLVMTGAGSEEDVVNNGEMTERSIQNCIH